MSDAVEPSNQPASLPDMPATHAPEAPGPAGLPPAQGRRPAEAAEPAGPADLPGRLAAVESKLDELLAASAREQERAAFRESVIDRLHAENQALRRGELDALLEPVRAGIVGIYDLARRAGAQYRRTDRPTAERGASLLDAVAEEAADVLERAGVTRIAPVVGEPLDATRHRAIGTRPAEHAWQDSTVVEVSAPGFAAAERLIRRAEVVIARYAQTEDPR